MPGGDLPRGITPIAKRSSKGPAPTGPFFLLRDPGCLYLAPEHPDWGGGSTAWDHPETPSIIGDF